MKELMGIPGSDGIVVGKILLYENHPFTLPPDLVDPGQEVFERERLSAAVLSVKADLTAAALQVRNEVGADEAEIFEAHLSVLEDPEIMALATEKIVARLPAATAFWQAAQETAALFSTLEDEYLRARAADVLDVGERVVRAVTGEVGVSLARLDGPCILVSHDITPSDTATMDKRHVIALVSETGSRTSHAVILSRSLGIPAVVGVAGIVNAVKTGDLAIVDGTRGIVSLSPDPVAVATANTAGSADFARRAALKRKALAPATTLDGVTVQVQGNIGAPDEADLVLENGGDGVGLFRSEFFYMGQSAFPDEELQYRGYRQAAEAMGQRPLIVRTMDIGGDKHLPYFDLPQELNPFLGWRALRISLDRPDIFRPQVRALLRAAAHGALSIMLPMVSSIDEIIAAKSVIEDCKAELAQEGALFNAHTPVGIMVEIPAIAMQAEDAAKLVDFFSIGTNDLLQYSLAVDRMNQQVAELYRPFHPGVLRLISHVIESARNAGIPVGMCGEMAGDPASAALLLGMGLDHFSMSPASIPAVKNLLCQLSLRQCHAMSLEALALPTALRVREYVAEFLTRHVRQENLPTSP